VKYSDMANVMPSNLQVFLYKLGWSLSPDRNMADFPDVLKSLLSFRLQVFRITGRLTFSVLR